jgi:ribosomal-protein-alanine N-acetyltransferase
MLKVPIETRRLVIRQFQSDDWQHVHSYLADPAVMAYIVTEDPYTKAQAREFVARNSGEEAKALAVTLKAGGILIGHLVFRPWLAPQTYEIGWTINKAYHGQGYATEAASALLQYAFAELKLHRVISVCQPENTASYRVMEKIGMRREGWFRQCAQGRDGKWWDEYFYAVLAEERNHAALTPA